MGSVELELRYGRKSVAREGLVWYGRLYEAVGETGFIVRLI